MLSVENLSMTFDKKVLYSNASFKVFKNDKIGIVGKNGVGKSTLIEILGQNFAHPAERTNSELSFQFLRFDHF